MPPRKKHDPDPIFDEPSMNGMRLFWFAAKWACVAAIWIGLIGFCVLIWYARELPDITRNPTFDRKAAITVLGNDGQVIARYGDHKGDSISVHDLPKHVVNAVLAIEDRRFYQHFGIDLIGLARAMFVNVTAQGVVQGGSTITQQLAKNLFLSQQRTFKRKVQEALLAIWLEHELTKDEILSAYLNRVYMGSGAFGIDAASKIYFKKDARNLTVREGAILAGLLKAPSRFSPQSNPQRANERAAVVIDAMIDAGFLPKDTKLDTPQPGAAEPRAINQALSARYFSDWIIDQVPDLAGTQDQDLTIETTFDPDIQKAATAALVAQLEAEGEKKNITQGLVMVARPDGSVLALVGGRDYVESEFNRAIQALRSPGSSFKPIVYLTALENGFETDTVVHDAPITEGKYRPTNFDGKYYGDLRLDNALALSLNTVSFQLAQQVGVGAIIGTARRLGITAELVPNLSLALGSSGVPAIEMLGAYTVIANGGIAVSPYGIKRIRASDGTILYDHDQNTSYPRVVSRDAAYDLAMMMKGVVDYGTGQRARLGTFVAGKTGTSQDYRDAWFSGFTPGYVATVWVGNDDNSSMKRVTGGSVPAAIWQETMRAALNDPTPSPTRMLNVQESTFDRLIGRIIGPSDPVAAPSFENDAAMPPAPAPETPPAAPTGLDRFLRSMPAQETPPNSYNP